MIRDIERKAFNLKGNLKEVLGIAKRVYHQQKKDKNKIYAIHAPEVECIAKGKVHKKYEFGCKVSIVTTSKTNWIVAIQAHHNNPYDGNTLKASIEKMKQITKHQPENVFADKTYRGKKYYQEGINVYCSGRNLKGSLKKKLKRRAAIEPVIGHLKSEHRMQRNHLLGKLGDQLNALFCGVGFNLQKISRGLGFGWMQPLLV